MDEELIRKVQLYLEQLGKESFLERHPLEEEGYWTIISGVSRYYGRFNNIMALVAGRFVDAIAYAVQQPDFKLLCDGKLLCAGYVIKMRPKKLDAVDGLEKLV